ncbi:MAG: tetratricopeptide repeat protein [Planctomycetota bacterium]
MAYVERGNASLSRGRLDGAIAAFTKATERDPSYAEAYLGRGMALAARWKRYFSKVEYAAVLRKPPPKYHHHTVAKYFEGKSDHDRAIADLTKAIEIKPDHAKAYYHRGLAYANNYEYHRAIADYTKAIELEPDYAEAYYSRGRAYSSEGKAELAMRDLERAIAEHPHGTVGRDARTSLEVIKRTEKWRKKQGSKRR